MQNTIFIFLSKYNREFRLLGRNAGENNERNRISKFMGKVLVQKVTTEVDVSGIRN
jgi:hypothetical protein